MNRRNLITFFAALVIAVTLVVVGVAIKYFLDYRASLTPVTFEYNHIDGASVKLYKGARKDLVKPTTSGDPVNITDGETRTLEDWPYVVTVDGNNIQHTAQIIYPHQRPQTVSLNIALTDTRLAELLGQNKQTIEQTILASNSKISELYTVDNIKLHGDGSWATASLRYNGDDKWTRDTLHAVLHKKDNSWILLAKPQITLSRSALGNKVPGSVFRAIAPERVDAS